MTILNKILKIGHIEFMSIISRYSIILLLLGGIFAYGFLYNFMYGPNVVRDAPIAVVDMARTPLSREYAQLLDATPQARVVSNNSDLPYAKNLMKELNALGIVYIPKDFDEKVGSGKQAVFVLYSVTTVFLYYVAMQESVAGAMIGLNNTIRPDQIVFLPQKDISSITKTSSIANKGIALFNYTDGYGTYLIPGVLIIIIFQTIMMLVSMLSGKEVEEMRLWNGEGNKTPNYLIFMNLNVSKEKGMSFSTITSIIIGKTSVYILFYSFFLVFMVGILPLIFQLPHLASPILIIQLMIPFLLSTCFFALSCSIFFSDSDAPLLLISFFSVGLVFLSGISYPLEQMPWYWQVSHFIFPVAPATLAFVKINSMGASMAESSQQLITLWAETIIYFITACLAYKYNIKKMFSLKNKNVYMKNN